MIDHVLLPIRDLGSAAESRRQVDVRTRRRLPAHARLTARFRHVAAHGGLWDTRSRRRDRQEAVLGAKLAKLLVELADSTVPVTLIGFPRSVRDSHYLYAKLEPVVGPVPYERFRRAFRQISRPDLVSNL